MLNPQQIQTLQSMKAGPSGSGGGVPQSAPMNDEQFKSWVGGSSTPQSQGLSSIPSKMVGAMGQDIKNAGSDVAEAIQGNGQYANDNPVTRGFEAASAAAGGVSKVAGEFVPQPIKDFVGKGVAGDVKMASDAVNWLGGKLGNSRIAKETVKAFPGATDFILNNTEGVAKTLNAAGNISGGILGAEGIAGSIPKVGTALSKVATEGANVVSDTVNMVKSAIPEKTTPVLNEQSILDKYNRAIKPTVAGKSNAGQIAQSQSKVVDGIKSIHENKANLEFTDSDGNVVKGELPKSVDQMSQAIAQTKKSIFEQYDALAKQAGEKGVTVDGASIAKELQPVIESKSLSIANPKAVQYAKDLQTRMNAAGQIDAKTAQDVIQHYNESLKAYYRNPSYDTASQASIDAMIANKFRESLDKGITGATGEQYQSLKNQYGALSSMEKDVAHRNVVWARQNKVGLASNISNIASGVELVRGLATLNPIDLSVGTTIKGIQLYQKYLNNPDVGVSKIFSEIDKSSLPSKGSTPESKSINKVSGSSNSNTTSAPKSKLFQGIKAASDNSNMQGGYVKNPLAGDKGVAKTIHTEDISALTKINDAFRSGGKSGFSPEVEQQILSHYGIDVNKSTGNVANQITKLLDSIKK